MTNNIDGRHICSNDADSLSPLLDCLDNILDTSLQIFLSVEMSGELKDFISENIISEGVGNGCEVELLLLCVHFNSDYYK